ncbi:AraC family transcriptional regulator [Olivibacter sitiensis]|uniref:AraC family transcriptional regulator n=1 Tax=Olivibacter sitiensis TaxID=376470 RepID=UPI0004175C7D|nr:AraC family transcriptional regulator [Olivibacter sitiensis]
MAGEKYYMTEVDVHSDSIYCYHNIMGEVFIPLHSHNKGQFLYTEGGVVFVKTPMKTFFLPARHYMWIAPGVDHSIHPGTPEVIMRNLYFPVYEDDDRFYSNTGVFPVSDLILQLLMFTARWHGDIFKSDSTNYTILESFKFLLEKTSKYDLPLALPLAKDERLRQVVNYLESNTSEDLLFNDLAAKFGFSPRSLSRLFQKDLGMSFIQYFTVLRMLKALQLLLEKGMSVNEVALGVGYNSLPTFSNTFQKIVGVRPSEYVKLKNVL